MNRVKSPPYSQFSQGFTLLEVMVALAIIAIALGAAVRVAGNATSNASYLADKTFANWVAMNEMTKIKIDAKWLSNGDKSGNATMLDRDWYWKRKVKKTPDKDVQRIEISVFKSENDSDSLITVTSFMARPPAAQTQTILR